MLGIDLQIIKIGIHRSGTAGNVRVELRSVRKQASIQCDIEMTNVERKRKQEEGYTLNKLSSNMI